MTDELATLSEGFRYDLWANSAWMEYLESISWPSQDKQVLGHILSAQQMWLRRCHGESLTAMPEVEVSSSNLRSLHERWQDVLAAGDAVIQYRNTKGNAYQQRVTRIARHVIDHGTYHRGELRGFCFARDDSDFPETGLIGFYMNEGLVN